MSDSEIEDTFYNPIAHEYISVKESKRTHKHPAQ